MISMAKGIASQGSKYFSKDDYYTAETGSWFGTGAKELGLTGEIVKADFDELLSGYGPNHEELASNAGQSGVRKDPISGKETQERIAYNDITISPPKSVSIMAVKDPRILDAHRLAVQKTLEELEQNYSLTRTGRGGVTQYNTKKLIVARYEHFESRELDPQLHTHCVIMNLTKRTDGKYGALENRPLTKDQKLLDLMYQANLTRELHTIGYETRRSCRDSVKVDGKGKNLKVEAFELSCISDELIEMYSKRSTQVKKEFQKPLYSKETKANSRVTAKDKLTELTEQFESTGETSEKLLRKVRRELINRAKLESRKPKNKNEVEEIRTTRTQSVLEMISDIQIPIEAKSRKAVIDQLKTTAITQAEVVIRSTVDALEQTESVLSHKKIIQEALKQSIGVGITADEFSNVLPQYVEKLKSGDYTTPRLRMAATISVEISERGKGKAAQMVPQKAIESYLSSLENRIDQPITFAPTQRKAIEVLCSSKDRVNILQGDAGTGKTFAMQHIRSILEAEGFTMRGLAPTGKAAGGLREAIDNSSTLKSFFESKMDSIRKGKEVWVVDECSMIGNIDMSKLLHLAEDNHAKVILLGDSKQLQSVSAGRAFGELQEHCTVTRCNMTETVRQKTDHAKEVVSLTKAKESATAISVLQATNSIYECNDQENRLKKAVSHYFTTKESGQTVVLLTQTNHSRNRANNEIRSQLVNSKIVDAGQSMNILSKTGISALEQLSYVNYKSGQIVNLNSSISAKNFNKNNEPVTIPRGTQAEIIGGSLNHNLLLLRYTDKKTGEEMKSFFELTKHGNDLQVYDREERKFGVGEEIIFLKNDKMLGVVNGDTGKIREIKDNGIIIADIGRKSISFTPDQYPYFDLGYAMTNHKAQGATYDHAIILCDDASRTNAEEWYVGITRARLDITVITDDIDSMKKNVGISNLNDSVLEHIEYSPTLPKPELKKTLSITGIKEKLTGMVSNLISKIDDDWKSMKIQEAAKEAVKLQEERTAKEKELALKNAAREAAKVAKALESQKKDVGGRGFGD